MEQLAQSAWTLFAFFFIGPPVLGAAIGALQMPQHRLRGALIGGAVGMIIGYAAFQIIVLNELQDAQDPGLTPVDPGPATVPIQE